VSARSLEHVLGTYHIGFDRLHHVVYDQRDSNSGSKVDDNVSVRSQAVHHPSIPDAAVYHG
jgi:hypothetical protein